MRQERTLAFGHKADIPNFGSGWKRKFEGDFSQCQEPFSEAASRDDAIIRSKIDQGHLRGMGSFQANSATAVIMNTICLKTG
jgi:hypothetical protein